MCESDSRGFCDAKEQTCPDGEYKCASSTMEMSYGMKWIFTESDNMK